VTDVDKMNDFMMFVALFVLMVITFAAPLIYMADTLVKAGWRDALIGCGVLALQYVILRYFLFTPVYLGDIFSGDGKFKNIVIVAVVTGFVCGVARIPWVFLSEKKPIPYESTVSVAKVCSAGMVVLFAGIQYLTLFLLRVGSIFAIGESAQKLAEFPQKARLFYAMSHGEDNLSILLFGIVVLIPAVIYSADTVIVMYGLRAKKYWYPVISALLYALIIVPVFALNSFGMVPPLLYLFAMMLIAVRINVFCRDQYYMYDMIARIDEKNRTGRPPRVF